jgi:hypothetical protein
MFLMTNLPQIILVVQLDKLKLPKLGDGESLMADAPESQQQEFLELRRNQQRIYLIFGSFYRLE